MRHRAGRCCGTDLDSGSRAAATTTSGPDSADTSPGSPPRASARTGCATPPLTWVERNFGYAVARAYAGHNDRAGDAGTTTTYVRADLDEIAAALTALTGEPHPLAPPACNDEREHRHG
jgi:hypothetical protein